jgi:hypothetical protein
MLLKAIATVVLMLASSARAHNFDEYLQSSHLALQPGRLDGTMQLHPGNGVADRILQTIDTDGDRAFSQEEADAYATRVVNDLALIVDGAAITPDITSFKMSTFAEIEDAIGTITIAFTARLPDVSGARRLAFRNGHLPDISVYLATADAPAGGIEVLAQERDDTQSTLHLDYQVTDQAADDVDFGNFAAMFALGRAHIAEGTDHLLFLLVLLIPAPLLAAGGHWAGTASVRQSVLQIVKVVTAFTAGHSLTLALASLGVVTLPSQPIEVLIAVSILVSAAHAVQPAFPGKEAFVAAFFGLIHGLAFASTISLMGLSTSERVAGLFGFNLGIEAMQLLVVAAVMPSLYLLSKTPAYRFARVGAAWFAAIAAGAWISERLFGTVNLLGTMLEAAAARGHWLAGGLFLVSLGLWSVRLRRQTRE